MTIHVKQAGVVKQLDEIPVKQGGVIKLAAEGWVKQGGVVKQFFTRVQPVPFAIYGGDDLLLGEIRVYNYSFPNYGTAVHVAGYDDGTGPYEFLWSMPVANNDVTFFTVLDDVSVSFDVTVPFEGTLRCDVTGTGPGGETRTLLLPITVSPNEMP